MHKVVFALQKLPIKSAQRNSQEETNHHNFNNFDGQTCIYNRFNINPFLARNIYCTYHVYKYLKQECSKFWAVVSFLRKCLNNILRGKLLYHKNRMVSFFSSSRKLYRNFKIVWLEHNGVWIESKWNQSFSTSYNQT